MLPLALGAFLALLAIGAVGHALSIAVRRRRHELAVLRALGLTRRQSRLVIATQASLLAVIGLAFGIPLGVALGRTLWRGRRRPDPAGLSAAAGGAGRWPWSRRRPAGRHPAGRLAGRTRGPAARRSCCAPNKAR